jgi:hypothetical protein
MKQIPFDEKSIVYDDLGRIVAIGNTKLPQPADRTQQVLAKILTNQSHMTQPLPIQTNQMDEAYNHTLLVKPKVRKLTPEEEAMEQRYRVVQTLLFRLLGAKSDREGSIPPIQTI